ncbi:hypothetical protein JW960_06155 [candidate division KSB1 bacterium]|nr:hypothetical protein [candidate division KSB1 bacterium]
MCESRLRLHGIVSLIFVLISFIIGVNAIAYDSVILSAVNAFSILAFFYVVPVTYCAKCRTREQCNHYIFGKISVMLSKFRDEPYRPADWLPVVLIMLAIIVLPQYWLAKHVYLLVSYWVLFAVAGIEVLTFICPNCLNQKCALCRNRAMSM